MTDRAGYRGRAASGAALALAVAFACTTERVVHPPPEGEWLEWEPKPGDGTKKKKPPPSLDELEAQAEKKNAGKAGKKSEVESLEADSAKKAKAAVAVKCKGADAVRESHCIALSEVGAKECPDKLPKQVDANVAGNLEEPGKTAKRDASLEASAKQCCYAWCAKAPSAEPPAPCKNAEDLFCFEAPQGGTKRAAAAPFADCPAGLKKTAAKGKRKAVPSAAFNPKTTKEERVSEAKACCYDACK